MLSWEDFLDDEHWNNIGISAKITDNARGFKQQIRYHHLMKREINNGVNNYSGKLNYSINLPKLVYDWVISYFLILLEVWLGKVYMQLNPLKYLLITSSQFKLKRGYRAIT